MNKKEIEKSFAEDFDKLRGSLNEQISHNRSIDAILVEDLIGGNFKSLEEHVEISKLVLDGVKALTSLYGEVPKILKSTNELQENEEKPKINIQDLMKESEESEDSKD